MRPCVFRNSAIAHLDKGFISTIIHYIIHKEFYKNLVPELLALIFLNMHRLAEEWKHVKKSVAFNRESNSTSCFFPR